MPAGGKREGAGRKKVERSTSPSVAGRVLREQKSEELWNEMVRTEVVAMRTKGHTAGLRETLKYLEDRDLEQLPHSLRFKTNC